MGGILPIYNAESAQFAGRYSNRVDAQPVKEWARDSSKTTIGDLQILGGRNLLARVWEKEVLPAVGGDLSVFLLMGRKAGNGI